MKTYRIVVILSACICMALLSGCTAKPHLLSNDFGTKDQSIVKVPKYQSSVIANSARLNLHPADIVLNVELYVTGFGGKQMVDFRYDPKEAKLSYNFTLQTLFTLTPKFGDIICKINYLAYNRLYSYKKLREVYEFHTMDMSIRYLPEFKGNLQRDVTVKYVPEQLLAPGEYRQLYTELSSMDGSQLNSLKNELDEENVNHVSSEDIKHYLLTIQSILKILGT
jgi:hypothetical protein